MQYLLTPTEYSLPNPRISGFRKLKEVNGKTVDIYLTSQKCFDYFKKNGQFPSGFEEELKTCVDDLLNKWPGYFLITRRAYVVSGIENPPGPHLTSSNVGENIKKLFQFAIEQHYDNPGNQIITFFHPFIGPEKFDKNNQKDSFISYGGYAVSQGPTTVEIYSVYGMNEGVQSLVVDSHLVEGNHGRYFITSKSVPQKTKMLCPTESSNSVLLDVPVEIQFDQVLSDNEVLEVARVVQELGEKYGPQRVEFSVNKNGLFFNEVADYWQETKDAGTENIQVKGRVKVIKNLDDFKKLTKISKEDLLAGKTIIEVGQDIVTSRNYDVLGALAAWKDNLFVLYPGVAATQHAMRILTDKGHRAFLIGNQKFEEEDEVQIIVNGGKVRITNLSRTQNQQYVSLWDASLLGVELCGGKADRLSKLKTLGFQVPHGAVCTTILFDQIMTKLGFSPPIKLEKFATIYELLKNPPPEIISTTSQLLTDYIKSGKTFSVRSSATIEDDSRDSMAGMFETYLNVKGDAIARKLIQVVRSAFAPKIVNYLTLKPELVTKLKMSVVLQEMVPARCAGVIFGAKVQTGDLNIVEIEAGYGVGENVVSGEAKEIEQYKFSRLNRRVVERKGPEILSASESRALFMLSERLRSEFSDVPQDIEWAIDQEGQIWLLQSRDLHLSCFH